MYNLRDDKTVNTRYCLLLLYRDTIQVLSDPPPPLSLSKSPFPPLKSVFSLISLIWISLIWEKQPDSLPQSPDWACLLPQAPKSVFSLIFDFRQTKFIAFLAPLQQCLVVPGRYHDFGIDSIPSTIPKSIDSIPSTRQTALIVLYPICFSSCRPNSNETRVPHFKAEIFQRKKN